MMDDYGMWLLVVAVAGAIAGLVGPAVIRLSRHFGIVCNPKDVWVEIPREIRPKSHEYPVPIIGGIAVYVAFATTVVAVICVDHAWMAHDHDRARLLCIMFGGLSMTVLGLLDDARALSYASRFVIQTAVIVAVLSVSVNTTVIHVPGVGHVDLGYLYVPLMTLWVLAVTNSINLIDGLDGATGGIVAISAATIAIIMARESVVVTISMLAVVGACLGFLKYNLRPAKLFLGSCGTLFLGFVLGISSIWGDQAGAANHMLPYALIVLSVPLVDMVIVMIARMRRGKNPFSTDSWHIHDRIRKDGVSYGIAAVVMWVLTAVAAATGLLVSTLEEAYLGGVLFMGGFFSLAYAVIIRRERPNPTSEVMG